MKVKAVKVNRAHYFLTDPRNNLTVNLCSSSISFINVYLPYCCESNTDTYLEYLGKLGELCEDIQHPNMCIIGDFNASNNNMFGPLLNSFCQDLNLTISDEAMLPKKSFTYVSDAHNTCSWQCESLYKTFLQSPQGDDSSLAATALLAKLDRKRRD